MEREWIASTNFIILSHFQGPVPGETPNNSGKNICLLWL